VIKVGAKASSDKYLGMDEVFLCQLQRSNCIGLHGMLYYIWPTGRAGLSSIRLVPSEMRPDTARNKNGSCHVSPSGLRRSPIDFYIFVFHKFCIFTYKLFNIIKFELKIHNFTLNNVIKIFYIIFCGVVPCWANWTDHQA
jgi:hypothetical protein